MSDNPRGSIRTIRERLENSEEISDADAAALRRMSERIDLLGSSRYTDHTHEKYLMRTANLAQDVGGLADALTDRDAAERLVAWINTTYTDSPESNKDYRVSLRQFGKLATDGEEIPDSLEWVPGGYPSNYDPAPDPGEMLRWESDILPMIDACSNLRDKALIALAWDLGPRAGELFDLTVDAISDHKYGLQVTVDGKQGRRSPILIPSVPYVNQWRRVHPATDDPDVTLWSNPNRVSGISNNRVRDILSGRARDAGVTRPVTPTNFRKSSASYLASQNVSQAHLEAHHGWTRGSTIAARYIAVFGEANNREVARAHGVDVSEDEADQLAPQQCPRCQRETPPGESFCVWCNQALAPEVAEEIQTKQSDHRFELLEFAKDNPEFLDRIQEMTELVELVDANPSIVREARRYADSG